MATTLPMTTTRTAVLSIVSHIVWSMLDEVKQQSKYYLSTITTIVYQCLTSHSTHFGDDVMVNMTHQQRCWPPLRQTGEDNWVVPASHGSAPSNRIWNITILRSPKQQIWLRTALCGGWCRRMALRNPELHARNDDDDDQQRHSTEGQ